MGRGSGTGISEQGPGEQDAALAAIAFARAERWAREAGTAYDNTPIREALAQLQAPVGLKRSNARKRKGRPA